MNAGEVLHRFSRDFGVPFLRGQRSAVVEPLGRAGLPAVQHGLGMIPELADACALQLRDAARWFDVTPAPFDDDAGTLLWAIHEAFASCIPTSTQLARAASRCRDALDVVQKLPRSFVPGRLVTRHLLVRRALGTTRTDVDVSWWTGSAHFFGEEVPARLVQWPALRRVKQDRRTTTMWRIGLDTGPEDVRVARGALWTGLLDASPLTRMMMLADPAQKALGFSLVLPGTVGGRKASTLDVLEDERLARGVVDQLLHDGLDNAGAVVALAALQALRQGAPPMVLRRAAELLTHAALVSCLIEAEVPGSRESAPLRALLDDDAGKLNEAVRVLWAVVASTLALGDDGRIELPDVTQLPDKARAIFERLRARLAHKRVVAVAGPLTRELARRLPAADAPLPAADVTAASEDDLPAAAGSST